MGTSINVQGNIDFNLMQFSVKWVGSVIFYLHPYAKYKKAQYIGISYMCYVINSLANGRILVTDKNAI